MPWNDAWSFDDMVTADLVKFPEVTVAGGVVGTSWVRTGTQSLRINVFSENRFVLFGGASDEYGMLFLALRFATTPGGNGRILTIYEGTTSHLSLIVQTSTRRLEVVRSLNTSFSPALVSDSSLVFNATTEYIIGFRWRIHDTNGEVEVQVNGGSWIAATSGLDTRNGGTGVFDGYGFESGGSGAMDIDDVCVGEGSDMTTLPSPATRVESLFPVAGSQAHAQWARSTGSNDYEVVDETPGQNGDTDYLLEGTTVNDKVSVPISSLAAGTGTVHLVTQTCWYSKSASGDTRGVKNLQRSGSTDTLSSVEAFPSVGVYNPKRDARPLNPASGSAYSISEVNGLQIGAQLTTAA